MGYETFFDGSIQVKRRRLTFNLSFSDSTEAENKSIDIENDNKRKNKRSFHEMQDEDDDDNEHLEFENPPKKKRRLNSNESQETENEPDICLNSAIKFILDDIPSYLFENIVCFAFYNESTSTLHSLRLISKNMYFLCKQINQNKLFPKVDRKTAKFINDLSNSRRMIRYRFINDIDYGMDGEYFIDTQQFGQNDNKYGSLYHGKAIDSNKPPRTQPSLWMQWILNEKKQCIEWDGGERFYSYKEWLVYLINNILNSHYIVFGEIEWKGEDPEDFGKIIIENNGENVVKTEPKNVWIETISKSKEKDIIWKDYFFAKQGKNKANDLFQAINDKIWIDAHKEIKDFSALCNELDIDTKDYLTDCCYLSPIY